MALMIIRSRRWHITSTLIEWVTLRSPGTSNRFQTNLSPNRFGVFTWNTHTNMLKPRFYILYLKNYISLEMVYRKSGVNRIIITGVVNKNQKPSNPKWFQAARVFTWRLLSSYRTFGSVYWDKNALNWSNSLQYLRLFGCFYTTAKLILIGFKSIWISHMNRVLSHFFMYSKITKWLISLQIPNHLLSITGSNTKVEVLDGHNYRMGLGINKHYSSKLTFQ